MKIIQEAEKNIPRYIEDNLMSKSDEHKKLVSFYLKTSKTSLRVAEILFNLSKKEEDKNKLFLEEDFECYLWVIVSSYYSMFYIANAALAKLGIKVGDKIAHKITSDCLFFYFIKAEKLAKHYFEEYFSSMEEALDVMGVDEKMTKKEFQQKALDLIQTFNYERGKRGKFQYRTTETIKESYALTSLNRARKFFEEIEKVIEKTIK